MDRKRTADRPLIEWVAGAASCAIVVALAGFLFHRAVTEDTPAPRLSVAVTGIELAEDGALVTVALTNRGGATAAAVRVRATRRGETATAREIEFDYIAGHAVRRGTFAFAGPAPEPDEVDVAVVGFADP